MENQLRELLTVDELAAKLKLRKSWIYSRSRLKGQEAMPGILRCGKYLRFEPETVLNWIRTKYGRPTSEKGI